MSHLQLPPITRETLRSLQAIRIEKMRVDQEKQRIYRVNQHIQGIYNHVVNEAEQKGATSYKFHVNSSISIQDMPDVLDGLRTLFPDSSVEHSLLVKGNDGNMYDVSKMDEKMRPFVNTQQGQQYIVIDWS